MLDDNIETNQKRQTNNFLGGILPGGDSSVRVSRGDKKTHQLAAPLLGSLIDAAASFNAFKQFRARHSVTELADYPDSRIMHFSILAILVLFEGLANAYFFSKGSDLGLLGGWIQAITVAFTNVIFAFIVIGFLCLRGLARPTTQPVTFALSALALPLAVGFVVFLNFSAGHYRDLLELNAATLALGSVSETGEVLAPVTRALTFQMFQTLEALLLFGLGLTFAAIAAYEGATLDDPIHGYGALQRRTRDNAAKLAEIIKQVPPEDSEGRSSGASTFDDAVLLRDDIRSYFMDAAMVGDDSDEPPFPR